MRRYSYSIIVELAKRLRGSKSSVIAARVAVTISIVVMVIALAVVDGFRVEINNKVQGLVSNYNIIDYAAGSVQGKYITRNKQMEQSIIDAGFTIHPYMLVSGLARVQGQMTGVVVKGIESGSKLKFFEGYLVEGRVPNIDADARVKEIIISQKQAQRLSLSVGSKLELIFAEVPPLRERFEVVGIFNTAIESFDKGLIITDIRNVQYINDVDSYTIGGYEVTHPNPNEQQYSRLSDIADNDNSGRSLIVRSISEDYPQIFSWLSLQQSNELVIITIMVVVVVINVVAMLLILLLSNIYQIGVLGVLGLSKLAIRKVFTLAGLWVIAPSLLLGNFVALLLIFVQGRFKIIKLDPEGYSIDFVPVSVEPFEVLGLNLLLIVIIALFQWITTVIINRVESVKVLKFESER